MTLAESIAAWLADNGITQVWAVQGGTIAAVIDACERHDGLTVRYAVREDQAGFACDGANRAAGRLVAALVEQVSQRRSAELARELAAAREQLDQHVRTGLGEGLSAADLGTLQEALAGVARAPGDAELDRLKQIALTTEPIFRS